MRGHIAELIGWCLSNGKLHISIYISIYKYLSENLFTLPTNFLECSVFSWGSFYWIMLKNHARSDSNHTRLHKTGNDAHVRAEAVCCFSFAMFSSWNAMEPILLQIFLCVYFLQANALVKKHGPYNKSKFRMKNGVELLLSYVACVRSIAIRLAEKKFSSRPLNLFSSDFSPHHLVNSTASVSLALISAK